MSTTAPNFAAAYYFLLLCAAIYSVCISLFYQYMQNQGSNPKVIQALKSNPDSPRHSLRYSLTIWLKNRDIKTGPWPPFRLYLHCDSW
jgi:hypothetical protein